MMDHTMQQAKILIVDDEPLNLKVLKQVLQDNYRLSFAKNGMDALELVHKEKPSLILLDVMMPGISGIEPLTHLSADFKRFFADPAA